MKMKTEAKRKTILEVAVQVFRELGFERASMSEICSRVGGSKVTLYNYFPSKEVLFFEVMSLATESEFEAAHRAIEPATEDIAESLRHFGEKFLAFFYSPEVRVQRHLAISESGRTELGRVLYERGVLRSQNLIVAFLQAQMTLDKLRHAEPGVATRHLCALLESELLDRFLFRVLGELGADEIKAVTVRAINVFMAAYATAHGRLEIAIWRIIMGKLTVNAETAGIGKVSSTTGDRCRAAPDKLADRCYQPGGAS